MTIYSFPLKATAGLFVLFTVSLVFIYLSADFRFFEGKNCYRVYADFDNISGLSVGGDVALFGVKIGKVEKISLKDSLSSVEVALCLNKGIKIPADSIATISYSNLFSGEKLVAIDCGADIQEIKDGEKFLYSRGALDLETLIRQFISNSVNK